MTEGKYEDLMNREIDGETTEREKAELETYLAQNPQAQAYREDLGTLANMFERVRDIEPPAELKADIVAAVRRQAESQAASRPAGASAAAEASSRPVHAAEPGALPASENGWASIVDVFRRRLALPSPYAFAGGVAVGALVFALIAASFTSLFRVDESVAPGALVPSSELAVFEALDAQSLALDGVRGEVSTKIYGDRLLVELQLESEVPVQVSVTPGAGRMVPVAFRQVDPRQGRVEFGEAEMAITHQGTNEYYFVLRGDAVGGSPLAVRAQTGVQTSEITLRTR